MKTRIVTLLLASSALGGVANAETIELKINIYDGDWTAPLTGCLSDVTVTLEHRYGTLPTVSGSNCPTLAIEKDEQYFITLSGGPENVCYYAVEDVDTNPNHWFAIDENGSPAVIGYGVDDTLHISHAPLIPGLGCNDFNDCYIEGVDEPFCSYFTATTIVSDFNCRKATCEPNEICYLNTTCSDGDPCTDNDFCVDGVCAGIPAANCDIELLAELHIQSTGIQSSGESCPDWMTFCLGYDLLASPPHFPLSEPTMEVQLGCVDFFPDGATDLHQEYSAHNTPDFSEFVERITNGEDDVMAHCETSLNYEYVWVERSCGSVPESEWVDFMDVAYDSIESVTLTVNMIDVPFVECDPMYFSADVTWQLWGTVDSDCDGDGIPDDNDNCPSSTLDDLVTINTCTTDVQNLIFDDGCTMSDFIAECADSAIDHGTVVSCVADLTNSWKQGGLISGRDKGHIQSCVAQSDIGYGCSTNVDCDDGMFCNGVEMCIEGVCVTGDPCPGMGCDEALDECAE